MSLNNFSANFGGTVGLCIGFSLLSLAEILYFFSLRPINDLDKRFMKKKKVQRIKRKSVFDVEQNFHKV